MKLSNLFTNKLEERVSELEDRLERISPKKQLAPSLYSIWYDSLLGFSSTKAISLEEKVNALAKHLKVSFQTSPSKESEVIVKKIKSKR